MFVDVTAAWCLTCKVNELAVLDRWPVASRLQDPDVVAMRADWTRPDPTISTYLQTSAATACRLMWCMDPVRRMVSLCPSC